MKQFCVLMLALAICGTLGFAAQPQKAAAQPTTPVVGLYYFPKNIGPYAGLTDVQIAAKLKESGINAVWGNERDASFVDACHAQGIKIYATLAMGYGWGDGERDRAVLANGKKIETYAPGHWYQGACPTDEDRILGEVDTVRDLMLNTKVDGVWLDSIRFPIYWETNKPQLEEACFCDRCLRKFQEATLVVIPTNLKTTEEKAQWVLKYHDADFSRWKMNTITDKVRRVKRAINATRPGATLGLFIVPWTTSEHNNAIERIVSQDLPSLAKYADVFSPMVYHRMIGQGENTAWINDIVVYTKAKTGKPVWPIVQSINESAEWNSYKMTNEEFSSAIKQGLKAPSGGVLVLTGADIYTNGFGDVFPQAIKEGIAQKATTTK